MPPVSGSRARCRAAGGAYLSALEQFSELRDARNGTPHHSILSCGAVPVCCAALQVRPAQCFALAPLAKKTLRLFVKCSRARIQSVQAPNFRGK
ncbi:hypothetical protein DVJ83_02735 [Deinococcus wulumuqiensis]|uniref:Uncharacterized protein n=1 Tax=Deinococcus wulumuqiensis TaxID=980427 RepID=A0A345IEY0_9DEIO|nr:hypothetical protein DVJ83_02735 [Deinococcus wulumuqiensis]